jgi:hypothetical protein
MAEVGLPLSAAAAALERSRLQALVLQLADGETAAAARASRALAERDALGACPRAASRVWRRLSPLLARCSACGLIP